MALNDHVLKHSFPGFLTGKLSDFAGIFYFPIFLSAVLVLFSKMKLSYRLTLAMIGVADLLLLMVKTSPTFAAFEDTTFASYLFETRLIADPTDLLALVMNYPTYRHCARYFNSTSGTEPAPQK